MDLHDQANASFVRGRPYSGFGGSTDFIVGALHSVGGNSFLALRSWHPKADASSVVPELKETTTSFQHSYVVTENGMAACFGQTEENQARNLISVAHEDAQAELTEAAKRKGLLP